MSRSLAQTVFLLIAGCLFMTLDCQTLRAQAFNNADAAAAAAKDVGTRTDKQLPDISGLVRECDMHGALMHKSLSEYTYTLVKVKRVLNDHNKVTRELVQSFEAYPIPGQHVLIQLSENGNALSPRAVAEGRRLAGEELERAERDAQKRNDAIATIAATTHVTAATSAATEATNNPGKYLVAGVSVNSNGKYFNVLIDLSEFLRSCEFSNPRREMVGKREAIVLSFRSRADAKFPIDMTFMAKLNGTVWIDAEDRVVMRLEGWPLPTTPPETKPAMETKAVTATKTAHEAQDSKQSGAAVIYQQVRLPTGVWVPSLIRMNSGGNSTLFNGLNWDVMFEFSDYKRYSTDIEGVQLEKPKKHL